ncbi:recombinase family protein [Kaistia terrae]|uniref:Recombinase family protein n=1 Tax=Kaistia terrae TaxID=537017 RepID=A0ABW0PYU9_9HYPH|nr:recombinase family protein [Kaistia terrae]MCX5580973.1 recombinase family protein [Kaistia terrae]
MQIGYARVSSSDQSLGLQRAAFAREGIEKVFHETASGAQRDRPELQKALDYLRKGDTLVVWKLDRLGRSLRQLIDTVESLKESGIEFRSLTESIDTSTAGGMLIFNVFGALAQFERSLSRERTMAGLQAAKDAGKAGGRPRSLSDSDLAAAKALLADRTITVKEVAERLGVSQPTLYRYLSGGRNQAAG